VGNAVPSLEATVLSDLTLSRRAARLSPPAHPIDTSKISLDSGYAFPGIFPDLTDAAMRALHDYRAESLQYGTPFGLPELREWIAGYMRADDVAVSSDDVLVVNGAKNGLELMCRLLVDEGDAIVVTGPTYFSAIPIFRSFGVTFVEMPQDNEGLDVGALERRLAALPKDARPKFIYDVPDFHNPTGITMSLRRREALISLAAAGQIPIIEDSPYRALRFDGNNEPSLKSLDPRNVFAVGTFSKLLAPGLRIGWISGPPAMLALLARLKSDGGTCPLTQRIAFEFLAGGGLRPLLDRARNAYRQHRDAMTAAVRREIPEATFSVPMGGYYLWVKFPEAIDTTALVERAWRNGVSVIAGPAFYASGASAAADCAPNRFVRLAFSRSDADEIERGVRLLAAAYRSTT
jgi:2-aminoadipate transaminase